MLAPQYTITNYIQKMSQKIYLQGITDNVKLAREHALLGSYSVSLAYYDGISDQIDSYMNDNLLGMDSKTQWAQLKQRLKQEYQIIQHIQNELNTFSNGLSQGNSNSGSNNTRMKPIAKFFEDQPEKSSGGGCAFVVNTVSNSNNNNSPPVYDDGPFGPRAKTPSANQQNISPQDNYDPDVWLPPTPVQGVSKPKRLQPNNAEKKVVSSKPVNNRVSIVEPTMNGINCRLLIMSIRNLMQSCWEINIPKITNKNLPSQVLHLKNQKWMTRIITCPSMRMFLQPQEMKDQNSFQHVHRIRTLWKLLKERF